MLVAGVVLIVIGRVLGITELFGMAAAAFVLVVAAVVQCRPGVAQVSVAGRVVPEAITRGERALLELFVENVGSSPTPANRVHVVPVGGGLHRIVVPRLAPGERATVTIALDTNTRGRRQVRAYDGTVTDTLGLASRKLTTSNTFQYLVRPRVEDLPQTLPLAAGVSGQQVARSSAERINSGASMLRQYLEGDDLRLIHWRTTARVGELMVREGGEPDLSGRSGITVLLVTHADAGPEFERAVEIASSLLRAASFDGTFRLVTTSELDSGTGSGPMHLDNVMSSLATVEPALLTPAAKSRAQAAAAVRRAPPPEGDAAADQGAEREDEFSIANLVGNRLAAQSGWSALFIVEPMSRRIDPATRLQQLAGLPPRAGRVVVIEVGAPRPSLERVGREHLMVMLSVVSPLAEMWATPAEVFARLVTAPDPGQPLGTPPSSSGPGARNGDRDGSAPGAPGAPSAGGPARRAVKAK